MNDQGTQLESEFVFRRLTETFKVFGHEFDGHVWIPVIILVLLLGGLFVLWMYIKDSRTVHWYWALPLAGLRVCVYLILALHVPHAGPAGLRARREEFPGHGRDRHFRHHVRNRATSRDARPSSRPGHPAREGHGLPSDEKVGFVKDLLDRNPVYIYRFGNRLDEESQLLKGRGRRAIPVHKVVNKNHETVLVDGKPWHNEDYQAFAKYDFKPWLLRGLSEDGIGKVKGIITGTARRSAMPTGRQNGSMPRKKRSRLTCARTMPPRSIRTGTSCWLASKWLAPSPPRPTCPIRCLSMINSETGTWSRA